MKQTGKALFCQEALEACQAAEELGVTATRLKGQLAQENGLERLEQNWLRGRVSDTFDGLQKAGRLELSMEALATKGKHGVLFSDEAVDFCLEVLVSAGYYGIR
jgi:hypothetical protein